MKKFLSLVLALVMAMSLVTVSAGAKDFTDSGSISGDKYAEAIDVMSALEIIDGYEGGAFQPQGTLTRGAAAKIIACMMLGKTTAEALGNQAAPFKDVPVGSTFAGYIAYCVEAGIIDGYADGTFRPSNKLTGFAFLKMLLTAMGYDSKIEGFTGTNWTVNVARRAIENGLTKGNDKFVGTALATREEACLYAVNTIKATLVEYETKGSQITINGATIATGASSPKVVTSVNASQATSINNDEYVTGATGQNRTYTVEFGEKYMPKLSLKDGSDDFVRSNHTWNYDGKKIGTYAETADLTYNKKVASDTIYDDLGLTSTVVAELYLDGVRQTDFTVQNNNTTKTGDTGLLTQVWKGGDFNSAGVWVTKVKITQVHYYVGDVVSKTAATKTKDAYVTIAARGDQGYPAGNFYTEDFKTDDVVIYNYTRMSGIAADKRVQNVAVAETATGTLSSFTSGNSATVGGTKYDYSCTIAREAAQASINTDVTVVLDPFGYAIDVDGKTDENYAVVLNYHYGLHYEATLLFADGTVKDVVLSGAYSGGTVGGNNFVGDIVAYTLKSSDRYALTEKADAGRATVAIKNGDYTFAYNSTSANRYANGKTIFLVKTVDANGNALYNAYEGIKNVPSVTVKTASVATVFCKNGDASLPATVVYVDATAKDTTVLNPASDVVFLKGNDDSYTYDSSIGTYYQFEGTLNGELKNGDSKIKTSDHYVGKGFYNLYDGVSYDANGVATLVRSTDGVVEGKGVYKQQNDVLGTMLSNGTFKYYAVASNCYVVLVNEEGDIQTGLTAGSVVQDGNDRVFFKLNTSNAIASAYIVKVAGEETSAASYSITAKDGLVYKIAGTGTAWVSSLSDVKAGTTVQVRSTTEKTTLSSSVVTLTKGTDEGNYYVYSFAMPAQNLSGNAFTSATEYTLTVKAAANDWTAKVNGETKTTNGTDHTATFTVTPGTYTVELSKAGQATLTRSVAVSGNTTVNFSTGSQTLTVSSIPSSATNPVLTIKTAGGVEVLKKSSPSASETAALMPGSYTVSFSADGYETQTKTVTVADTAATVSFDAWTPVAITKVGVNSTVTLSKDGVAVASVTNATTTATLNVVGTVTDYAYAITASDAVVVGGTGDVSGATFTANEKIYKLGTVTIAAEASGLAAKITVPTAASYTALTAAEKVSYTVSMVKDGSETVLETKSGLSGADAATGYTTGALNVAGAYLLKVVVTVTNADNVQLATATVQSPVTLVA